MALALCLSAFACHRAADTSAVDLAHIDLGKPGWTVDIDGTHVVTTTAFGPFDLDACESQYRHRKKGARDGWEAGHGCPSPTDSAAAAKRYATISWPVLHPCGSEVTPHVQIAERVIMLTSSIGASHAANGHRCWTQLTTVLDNLPARRWRIIGGAEERLDLTLDVPDHVVH